MVDSYYVVPCEEARASQISSLEEFVVSVGWKGPWIYMVDWNEEFSEGWIGTLSLLFGGLTCLPSAQLDRRATK